jgi:hypothetical protein
MDRVLPHLQSSCRHKLQLDRVMRNTMNTSKVLLVFALALCFGQRLAATTLINEGGSAESAASPAADPDTRGSVHNAVTHVLPRQRFIVRIAGGNKLTGTKFGHGICLDSPCVHVLTNYHVAGLIDDAKVEGVGIKGVRFATGKNDDDAIPLIVIGGIHRWNPQRDMALITLKKALSNEFTAAEFADYMPVAGTAVVRYPAAGEVYSGTLIHYGRVKYLDGTGARQELESMLLSNFDSPPGVSGGALCDAEGRVLGLNEFTVGSMAIPVPIISGFLLSANPELWRTFHFQKIEPIADSIAEEIEPASIETVPLRFSVDPDSAVRSMVEHAEQMRLGMSRVIAKAEVLQSGPGVKENPKHFEVSLYDAGIRWRAVFPNGALGNEIPDFPLPQTGVIPGADWDYLLGGLQKAEVTYLGDTFHDNDVVHVFNFDKVRCPWREQRSTGEWSGDVECHGKVYTDLAYHPVSIQAEFGFGPSSIMSRVNFEIAFVRIQLANGQQYELPSSVEVKAKYKRNFGTYKASVQLADYRPFGAEHVIRMD